ncbi:hypothetical protein EVAR_8187_1 [Eumeta japonica]|uniref:Uncharacterized protein n=1 Tax=Eumeta variegata TaxID=151549 RepID=A0A4C1TI48_EUMVA|nr:hypothetical protein EVAR_8187_1 [Eumeta japonica]
MTRNVFTNVQCCKPRNCTPTEYWSVGLGKFNTFTAARRARAYENDGTARAASAFQNYDLLIWVVAAVGAKTKEGYVSINKVAMAVLVAVATGAFSARSECSRLSLDCGMVFQVLRYVPLANIMTTIMRHFTKGRVLT